MRREKEFYPRVLHGFFICSLLFLFCSCDNLLINKIVEPKTVIFESNGGSGVDSQTVFKNQPVRRPSDPSRNGYDFNAWYRDNETFLEEWDFAAIPAGDITLYAKWSAVVEPPGEDTFTVTFDKNGGDTDASPVSRTIESGGLVTAPETDPAREDFEFAGWYQEADCINIWNFETDAVTADITLYAKWETISGVDYFTVTFDKNGGETEASPHSRTVVSGGLVTAPTAPTRTGYTLAGWYKEEDFINIWNFAADTVTEDITLYAKWEINQYTVSFDEDGGTPAPAQQTVDHGGKLTEPAAIIKTGFTFGGWYKDAAFINKWNFENDTVTAITTLFAKWEALPGVETHTVTFNKNGGNTEAQPSSRDEVSGGLVTAPSTPPTRTGYTLAGWYKEAACLNIWNFTTDTVTANMTLYAKWNINQYTVNFNADGGTPAPAQQTVNHGGKVTAPTAPTKNGYTFDGWYKEAALTNQWNFTTDTVTANIALYAKWETIPTDSGDGSADDPFIVWNEQTLRKVGTGTDGWTLSAHYRQTANIPLIQGDWTRIGTYTSGQQFTGSYNGDGHTITGLTIAADTSYQGMFGYIGTGGKVENLGLIDVNITNFINYIGGIAGYNNGTIQNCYVTGSVTSTRSTGSSENIGGIAGYNNGTIQNCYATGIVRSTVGYTGGIAGYNSTGTIRNCVALHESVVITGAGAFLGRITSTSGTLQNNYAWSGMTVTINGNPYNIYSSATFSDGANITAVNAKTETWWTNAGRWSASGTGVWDFSGVWKWDSANSRPVLKNEDPQPWPPYLVDPGSAGITLTVEHIEEGAPLPSNDNITISRTGPTPPVTFSVTVSNPGDYTSINWEVAGAGNYAGQTVTGSGATFALNGAEVKYNTLGGHTLKLTVVKGGLPYQRNINFTVVP